MENNILHLIQLGLTEGEAKVYLALLELGSSTVGPVVKKSGVAYSNIYEILNRLLEKGLASYVVKEKTKYFQASPPQQLTRYLRKKEEEVHEQQRALQQSLPELMAMQHTMSQQEAEIFTGLKGLRAAYEILFADATKKDEELFFYIHDAQYAEVSDRFYLGVQDIFRRAGVMKGICNEQYRQSKFFQQAKFIRTRFVAFPIPGNIEVCKDKLLLVSWEKPVVGVLIHSASIAENFRTYFNTVWQQAKA